MIIHPFKPWLKNSMEKNYCECAQSIQLVIEGKEKLGYLNGEIEEPASLQLNSLQNGKEIRW